MDTNERELHMERCLQLGREALDAGDPPVGAVIVKDGVVIGEGVERGKSTGDVTRHAEIEAIRDAIDRNADVSFDDCVMFTTHEPCIMCSYVIRHHHIPEIVFGCTVDHVGGFSGEFRVLMTTIVPRWGAAPKVVTGILENECRALSQEFQSHSSG